MSKRQLASAFSTSVLIENFRQVAEGADAIAIGKPLESLEEIEVHDYIARYEFSVSNFAVDGVLKGGFQEGDIVSAF